MMWGRKKPVSMCLKFLVVMYSVADRVSLDSLELSSSLPRKRRSIYVQMLIHSNRVKGEAAARGARW